MASFTVICESQLSPEALFDYLADMRNASKWDPGVSGATLMTDIDTGLRKGSRFLVTLLLAGRPRQVMYELVEYDRPRHVTLRAIQPAFTSTDMVSITSVGSGRGSVTYEANLELHGLFRLGTPLVTAAFTRIGRRAAAGLQREVSV